MYLCDTCIIDGIIDIEVSISSIFFWSQQKCRDSKRHDQPSTHDDHSSTASINSHTMRDYVIQTESGYRASKVVQYIRPEYWHHRERPCKPFLSRPTISHSFPGKVLKLLVGKIPFKWKDAFDRSIFGGKLSLTVSSLSYERVCVLFNIAALQSSIAAVQILNHDEGLKLCAKLLQQSAGIFSYLRDHVMLEIQQEPTPDMSSETLEALSLIMLAQAQEIFTHKAIHDGMKESIVAKLAAQTEELFSDALKLSQKEIFRAFWDKEWVPLMTSKQLGYRAISEYYQSRVCRTEKKVGEEITRLELAVGLLKEAQMKSDRLHFVQEYSIKASRCLDEIKRDNDFIYHERIPDPKDVPVISKANVARPTDIPEKFCCDFEDLFDNLLPASARRIRSKFTSKKSEILNAEIAKLKNIIQILTGTLANLNLPAAIEDTSGTRIPKSLLEKIDYVNEIGGMESLDSIMQELPELLQRNTDILNEVEKSLEEEQASDEYLQSQFRGKWTRLPSSRLNEQFRMNIYKYRSIINNAIEADKIVREKFKKQRQAMTYLVMDPSTLQSRIPDGSALKDSVVVHELKGIMKKVDSLKAKGESLEGEIKRISSDSQDLALSDVLRENMSANDDILISKHVETITSPLQEKVQTFVQCSEDLIELIKVKHAEFATEQTSQGSDREQMLRELAVAYNMFRELRSNLQEGVKFYNDLTQLLIVFQNKISDFCFARKTEKEELLKDLTSRLSRDDPKESDVLLPNARSASQCGEKCDGKSLPYPVGGILNMPVPFAGIQGSSHPDYMPLPMPTTFNPYSTIPGDLDGSSNQQRY